MPVPTDPNRVIIQIEGYSKINGEGAGAYQGAAMATKGHVGISTGSGKMEFRNLRFREF